MSATSLSARPPPCPASTTLPERSMATNSIARASDATKPCLRLLESFSVFWKLFRKQRPCFRVDLWGAEVQWAVEPHLHRIE